MRDDAHREAQADGGAGVGQAAIDPVINIERPALLGLNLDHDRLAFGHQGAAGLAPQPAVGRQAELGHTASDRGQEVRQGRRLHVGIGDGEPATDIEHV